MFFLKDLLFGGKQTPKNIHVSDDGDFDDTYTKKKNRHQDYYDENEEYDGWEEYEEDGIDYPFFEDMEKARQFKPGELLYFYKLAREAYASELPSMNTRNTATIERDITTFIHNYIGYLLPPPLSHPQQYEEVHSINLDDITTQRSYPRIILIYNSEDTTPGLLCSQMDEEGCTFRVDRRFDFVYSYVIEKGIIDTLKTRGEQMLQYANNEFIFMETILNDIDSFKEIYRMRVNSQYVGNNDIMPEEMNSGKMSGSWAIYTRRSSHFFKRCIDAVKENDEGLSYSDQTLRIESIPFQQVLLLCGNCPGFVEKYAPSSMKDGPIIIEVADADDWVAVPIWFSLFAKIGSIV